MPIVELFDKTKNKVGQIELSDRVFGVTVSVITSSEAQTIPPE